MGQIFEILTWRDFVPLRPWSRKFPSRTFYPFWAHPSRPKITKNCCRTYFEKLSKNLNYCLLYEPLFSNLPIVVRFGEFYLRSFSKSYNLFSFPSARQPTELVYFYPPFGVLGNFVFGFQLLFVPFFHPPAYRSCLLVSNWSPVGACFLYIRLFGRFPLNNPLVFGGDKNFSKSFTCLMKFGASLIYSAIVGQESMPVGVLRTLKSNKVRRFCL